MNRTCRPRSGCERSVSPESVDLTRFYAWNECVPIVVSEVSQRIDGNDTRRTSVIDPIKEQQFYSRCASGEDGEVCAPAIRVAP